jgi:hypothetical protein
VGPRAGLDGCGKSRPHRDSIPGPSSQYRVAIPTELSWPTWNNYLGYVGERPYTYGGQVEVASAQYGPLGLVDGQSGPFRGPGPKLDQKAKGLGPIQPPI